MKVESVLDGLLESYHEEMCKELQALLRFKTIRGVAGPRIPFGIEIGRALDYIMDLGRKKGFDCIDFDGYACEMNLRAGDKAVGVISHLDVVPEGLGWAFKPYGGEIIDGKIYGRGAVDDKGPLIAAFYACLAIKESGLPISKTIKQIIGTDEESGKFDCIKYYKEKAEVPALGIVPDSWFPAVYAEKGFVNYIWTKKIHASTDGDLELVEIIGGEAFNIVASNAQIKFKASHVGKNQIAKAYAKFKEESMTTGIEILDENGLLCITFSGLAAHASVPEDGINAISLLLRFLKTVDFDPPDLCATLHQLAELIGNDSDGEGLGVGFEDHTGALTNNVGIIHLNQQQLEIKMNIRCPVTLKMDELYSCLIKAAGKAGMSYELINYNPHFYIDPQNVQVKMLVDIYRAVTGDYKSQPKAHGGGSYARILENFIPFGPSIQDEPLIFHKHDEYISVNRLLILSKIYARALYEMAK